MSIGNGHGGETVRVGVLGVGRIGRMHAELLSRQVVGAALGMVYDAEPASATRVGAALDVPVASSAEDLLASPDLDAVAICTSTDTHVDLLLAAAGCGKVIFCEKPISLDLADVDRALGAIEDAGAPLQIGFNRRFDPAHRFVRDAVERNELGALHLVRISSRDPAPPPLSYLAVSGGIFLDMTCHDIDMARFVTGSEVAEVYATGAVRIDPAIGDVGDLDTAVLTLRHVNGCLTVIDNSRRAAYGYDQRVEAFGELGMASSQNPLAHTGSVLTVDGGRSSALPYFFVERYRDSYLRQWEAFVAFARARGASPVSGADGRAPLVVGMAAWRSAREGRPVELAV